MVSAFSSGCGSPSLFSARRERDLTASGMAMTP
jgi:hypothetical protein